MKVGVISDTHAHSLDDLPKKIIDEISGVDLIIHAGDYTGKKLLDELRKVGNFKGVYGNMDPYEVRRSLPDKLVFEANNFIVGVAHPSEGGIPVGMERRIRAKFGDVNVVICGHSHKPRNEVVGDILYFNPGSATGAFPSILRTYGILRIEKEVEGIIARA